jgi:quercetin dioxygenase-like cupin family protein
MARVLDNPRSGERIVIVRSGADTDGELLQFDVFLQPGAHVPAGHVHPLQQEHFRVVAGRVRFRIGARTLVLGPGSRMTIPPGARHWFGNVGEGVAQLRVEARPALRMEELFATSVRCADAASGPGWRRLLDWLLIPLDFSQEVGIPRLAPFLVAALLSPLAWLRNHLSARA